MLITDVYICETLLLYLRSICDVMCKVCLKIKNKVKQKKQGGDFRQALTVEMTAGNLTLRTCRDAKHRTVT